MLVMCGAVGMRESKETYYGTRAAWVQHQRMHGAHLSAQGPVAGVNYRKGQLHASITPPSN